MKLPHDSEAVGCVFLPMRGVKAGGRFEGHQLDLAHTRQRKAVAQQFEQAALGAQFVDLAGDGSGLMAGILFLQLLPGDGLRLLDVGGEQLQIGVQFLRVIAAGVATVRIVDADIERISAQRIEDNGFKIFFEQAHGASDGEGSTRPRTSILPVTAWEISEARYSARRSSSRAYFEIRVSSLAVSVSM